MEIKQPELLQLFPKPVLIAKYPEDLSKELEYVQNLEYKLNDEKTQEVYSKQSTNTFLLDEPELIEIRKFIDAYLKFYVNNILSYSNELIITQSWTNICEKGKKHHEHVHPNSIVSGVFYFQINEKLPPIEFKNSNAYSSSLVIETKTSNNFNSSTFLLPLNSGELILFPSNLMHSVPENLLDIPRISLAFNTFAKNSLGSIKSLTYLPINS
jgi:uncharacterized protein (TIGR02466 family)